LREKLFFSLLEALKLASVVVDRGERAQGEQEKKLVEGDEG
jgi:hypothetical protein